MLFILITESFSNTIHSIYLNIRSKYFLSLVNSTALKNS